MGQRITVVTSGHLSTCPRMLKSADALAAAGYDVRVVAASTEPWAIDADRDVRSRRSWPATIVNYRKGDSGLTYWWTGARTRASRAIVERFGPERAPLPLVVRSVGRVHTEIVRAAAAQPADLIYGGTTGALAAVAEAAHRLSIPYALDLEDFHSAETAGPDAARLGAIVARVERAVLGGAAFLTTSSDAIAAAYRTEYQADASVIHNVFTLPASEPDASLPETSPLRLYWFSQTIGPNRGLVDAVAAVGRAGITAELALRGRPQDGYLDALTQLAATHAPNLRVTTLPPAPPDTMIDLARGHHVGLALEAMAPRNRQLCVTNKAFTYMLAGLAVAISDTPGQHALGEDMACAAALVPPGDVDALASALHRWAGDPSLLARARKASWEAAVRRWRWDSPQERGVLLDLVAAALA